MKNLDAKQIDMKRRHGRAAPNRKHTEIQEAHMLWLREQHGFTYRRIAEIFGITIQGVISILERA